MNFRILGLLFLVSLVFPFVAQPATALAQENYRIGPADDPSEINPLPANGWLAMDNLPPKELTLYKLTYLRGFLDALRFSEAIPEKALDILDEYKGLSLAQLAAQLDEFYKNNPQYRHISPVTVMVVILPRLKQGLPALPAQETEDQNNKAAEGNKPN